MTHFEKLKAFALGFPSLELETNPDFKNAIQKTTHLNDFASTFFRYESHEDLEEVLEEFFNSNA